VIEEMDDWSVRPLDAGYAAVFIGAIVLEVRDGQVANRPVYAAIGVTLDGEKDVLGLWAGFGGEMVPDGQGLSRKRSDSMFEGLVAASGQATAEGRGEGVEVGFSAAASRDGQACPRGKNG
jgi:hypothetical protein